MKAHVFAGMKAGKTAEEIASSYEVPESLSDFGFVQPFANNFVQLMMDESTAK